MALIVYEARHATDLQFIEYWSRQYSYDLEPLYCNNIGRELTEDRTLQLFKWKNGRRLSGPKHESVQRNFVSRLGELQKLEPNQPVRELLDQFATGGVIWRIFWLHCWKPERFPIYDQHVFRAMTFIECGKRVEIPADDAHKIESYISRYLPFHARFCGLDQRKVDRALWQFGKFLKTENCFPTTIRNEA